MSTISRQDITLAPQCATLLGYTQAEPEAYFDEYLTQFCQAQNVTRSDLLAKIREWYNGCNWQKSSAISLSAFRSS